MDFLESEHWNCGGSVDPREIISVGVAYEGSVNLDVSLSGRSIDFSSKGAISITFTFLGGASVSCTVSGEFPGGIPIPGTGLTIEFGGEGVVQVSNPSSEDGGSLSVTGGIRAYTGFYYIDGEKGGTGTANPFAVFRAADDREATAQLDLGLTTSVTIADVPFVPEPYEVEAGLTTGVSFRMEAPSPNDDPYHRTLRGPAASISPPRRSSSSERRSPSCSPPTSRSSSIRSRAIPGSSTPAHASATPARSRPSSRGPKRRPAAVPLSIAAWNSGSIAR
ncbi:hypothetical protein [Leucobacter soli]|uniref:hypothetical protein n=1 Tax=Leucobacter soli TaxID=2812850 RepID=UPI00360EE7F9